MAKRLRDLTDLRKGAIGSLRAASLVGAGALALVALGPVATLAQEANAPPAPPAAEADQPAAPEVPKNVLAGLLAEGDQSAVLIRSFLAGEGSDPDAISRRAVDLVEALKQSGLVADPSVLALAAQRVARAASDTLSAAPILQLKVDKGFEAPPGVRAFDFGPPDKAPVDGFERVLPNDPMLKGQVRGLRRPGDESGILSGGVAGVQNMKINLPDGEYRVTLLTESIGDAALSLAPFGETINANGQQIRVSQAPPDHWSRMTVLSNEGLAGADSAGGSAGGAVTLTVRVVGGELVLGFQFSGGNRALQTYLTGMVVEPVTQPSVFARTPDAPPIRQDVETRLKQEATIMAALVTAAQPTAGQPLNPAQNTRPSASPS